MSLEGAVGHKSYNLYGFRTLKEVLEGENFLIKYSIILKFSDNSQIRETKF
jgi:hypothetical protein